MAYPSCHGESGRGRCFFWGESFFGRVGPIHISRKFPTLRDCLRELGQRIERDDVPTYVAATQKLQKDDADASTKRPADEAAASLNANDVLILHLLEEIYASLTHWVGRGTGTPKDKDEVNNREVCECEG
jgi:hypothetical protein